MYMELKKNKNAYTQDGTESPRSTHRTCPYSNTTRLFYSSPLSSLIASHQRVNAELTTTSLTSDARMKREHAHILHVFRLPMLVRELTEPTPNELDGGERLKGWSNSVMRR